jgi:hypothetical protein
VNQWLTNVTSAVVIAAASALIAVGQRRMERKMDAREAKAADEQARKDAWREGMSARTGRLERIIDTILTLQCSQVRADILHKCHRYLDDIGKASTEEKESLWAENEDYRAVCEAHGIENHYIDKLVERVMQLPERDI